MTIDVNKQCVISFDFDDTLAQYVTAGWYGGQMLVCVPKILQLLKEYHALGCKCIILTARTSIDQNLCEINRFLIDHEIDHAVSDIVFTSHQPKGPFAKAMDVNLHYDDSAGHLNSVRAEGIKAISSIPDPPYPDFEF